MGGAIGDLMQSALADPKGFQRACSSRRSGIDPLTGRPAAYAPPQPTPSIDDAAAETLLALFDAFG